MFKKREYLEYVLYISIKDVTRRGFPHHSWDYEPMKFWWGRAEGPLINYLLRTARAKRTVVVREIPLINFNRVAQTIVVIFPVALY